MSSLLALDGNRLPPCHDGRTDTVTPKLHNEVKFFCEKLPVHSSDLQVERPGLEQHRSGQVRADERSWGQTCNRLPLVYGNTFRVTFQEQKLHNRNTLQLSEVDLHSTSRFPISINKTEIWGVSFLFFSHADICFQYGQGKVGKTEQVS